MTPSSNSSSPGHHESKTDLAPPTTNQQGTGVEIPSEFICPITLQLMDHPLVNKRGVNFERSAILKWLSRGEGCCPITRIPMTVCDLIPNRLLEAKIALWREANGIPEAEGDTDEFAVPLIGFLPITREVMEQVLKEYNISYPSAASIASISSEEAVSLREHSLMHVSTGLKQSNAPDDQSASDTPDSARSVSIRSNESDRHRKLLVRILDTAVREVEDQVML